MDDLKKNLIRILQDSIPLTKTPFADMANQLGVSEAEVIREIEKMLESGEIRRFGAVVAHRSTGYVANAMVAWRVPEEEIDNFAEVAVSYQMVSHCYERETTPEFPYNLYTMIHGRTREETLALAAEISDKTGITQYKALFSGRELKKQSMRYY